MEFWLGIPLLILKNSITQEKEEEDKDEKEEEKNKEEKDEEEDKKHCTHLPHQNRSVSSPQRWSQPSLRVAPQSPSVDP